jgi:hypothetical protein
MEERRCRSDYHAMGLLGGWLGGVKCSEVGEGLE